MADAVGQAISGKHHLMVEAGTGVGKSFAYLVPAIPLAACAEQGMLASSCSTRHRAPAGDNEKGHSELKKVMPQEFNAALVKRHRGNYLSLRRLREAKQRMMSLLAEDKAQRQLDDMGRWSKQTVDGSRSDLSFQPLPRLGPGRKRMSNCLGRNCKIASVLLFERPTIVFLRAQECSVVEIPCSSATWLLKG